MDTRLKELEKWDKVLASKNLGDLPMYDIPDNIENTTPTIS